MFGNKKKLEQQLSKEGGTVAWATIADVSAGWATASMNGFNQVTSETDHVKVAFAYGRQFDSGQSQGIWSLGVVYRFTWAKGE